jgi:translation initiation factor 2 beta subunit (eIF-2beta)/eIF-5
MDTKIFELLDRKIEDQIKSHSEALVSGQSKDYAQYRELCGVIRGLQTAQREIGDLVRKLKDDNDD